MCINCTVPSFYIIIKYIPTVIIISILKLLQKSTWKIMCINCTVPSFYIIIKYIPTVIIINILKLLQKSTWKNNVHKLYCAKFLYN